MPITTTCLNRPAAGLWRATASRLARDPAIGSALVALAVYGATMFPGLAGIGDTPKFQFVGSVLGTPHSPGYPLYILLSWVFAHLPVGTLAFRMNLMSAVFGACAVGLIAAILAELGCRRAVAFAGALLVGFGRVFWSQALLAEVYTLNAALFCGGLLYLLRWRRTREDRDLYGAGVFVALGGAHHLTLVMTLPALVAFVLVTDARRALRPVVVARLLAIAAGAALLYGLIWLRTAEHAPFLEVRAHSLGDLLRIVSARQFADHVAPFSRWQLVHVRVPLLRSWMAGELHVPGLLLCAVGVVALVSRSRAVALLLGGAAACVLVFALNYDVYDIQVFLILPMIVAGIVAAIGLETVARLAAPRVAGGGVLVGALAVAIAAGQFRANVRENDQHRHRFEARYFRALFAQLPARTALVEESYPVDHMVLYELVGEHAARGRTIALIPATAAAVHRYARDGFAVFAFSDGRQALARQGLDGVEARFALPRPPLRHILDTEAETLAFPIVRIVDGTAEERSAAQRAPR